MDIIYCKASNNKFPLLFSLICFSSLFLISGCCAWKCIESPAVTSEAIQLRYTRRPVMQIIPKPDIRFAIDTAPIEKGLRQLDNLKYTGKMDGGFCKLTNIDIWSIGHNRIRLENWYDGISNTYGTFMKHGFELVGSVDTKRCGDWTKDAAADIRVKLGKIDFDKELILEGILSLDLSHKNEMNMLDKLSFRYDHEFKFIIPKPFDMRNTISIKVGKKSINQTDSVELLFGRIEENEWISEGNRVDIPIALNFFSAIKEGRNILI